MVKNRLNLRYAEKEAALRNQWHAELRPILQERIAFLSFKVASDA